MVSCVGSYCVVLQCRGVVCCNTRADGTPVDLLMCISISSSEKKEKVQHYQEIWERYQTMYGKRPLAQQLVIAQDAAKDDVLKGNMKFEQDLQQ